MNIEAVFIDREGTIGGTGHSLYSSERFLDAVRMIKE